MFQNDAKKAGNRPRTNVLVANRPGSAAKVNLFNNYTKNAYYQNLKLEVRDLKISKIDSLVFVFQNHPRKMILVLRLLLKRKTMLEGRADTFGTSSDSQFYHTLCTRGILKSGENQRIPNSY